MLFLYYLLIQFVSALPMSNTQFISYINQKCTWKSHCLNDPCITFNDCDGQLICVSNICNIDLTSIFPQIKKVIPTDISKVIPTDISKVIPINIQKQISPVICSWASHCLNDSCLIDSDCDTELVCTNNKCKSDVNIPTVISKVISPLVKKPTDISTGISTVISKVIPPIIQQPVSSVILSSGLIPITSGNSAVITYFTDQSFQCISGQPIGNALAINPLLLGFTAEQYSASYANADPSAIPWCNKQLTLTVNGKSFSGEIIDTCNPVSGDSFVDPKSGQIIGGKCDYQLSIDLHGKPGLNFLNSITNGNDFFDGTNSGLIWTLT